MIEVQGIQENNLTVIDENNILYEIQVRSRRKFPHLLYLLRQI